MKHDMTGFERLGLKPDYQDTIKRYEAFWNGDLLDRPLIRIVVPRHEFNMKPNSYYDRIYGDLDDIISRIVHNTRGRLYLGESLPQPLLTFGPGEIAAYCGGKLHFHESNHDTNWAEPFVDEWEAALPISLKADDSLWLRMQSFIAKCADAMQGEMLFSPLDLHTNLDLLMGMRGIERLCMDLIDCPDVIDKAMEQTMGIFDQLYEHAYEEYNLPSPAGFEVLQCDFSCMISSSMFERFALPYLEREAEYFRNRILYHWDGVDALTHTDSLIASKNLYLLGFLPGAGNGEYKDYLNVYEKIQAAGKAVSVGGSPDEIKYLHKSLKPNLTVYDTSVDTVGEAEELLRWFVENT